MQEAHLNLAKAAEPIDMGFANLAIYWRECLGDGKVRVGEKAFVRVSRLKSAVAKFICNRILARAEEPVDMSLANDAIYWR